MHMIIAYDTVNDSYIAIGSLTSEDNPFHTKLSDDQPISDNKQKKQYFKPMNPYIHIEKTDFDLLSTLIEKIQSKTESKVIMSYNSKGITLDDLNKMLILKAEQPVPLPKKMSHFEIEKQKAKAEKLAKATLEKKVQTSKSNETK